jgi:7-cyano-7-deazaguanine reductase
MRVVLLIDGGCASMATQRKKSGLSLLKKSCTKVPARPSGRILEAFRNTHPGRDYVVRLTCPEFTSLCPITGQPDFGKILIEYVPDKLCLESKSFKLYMFSFRNHGAFHEEVVNRILDDLVESIHPRTAVVTGNFRPRGGIAITVEARHPASPIAK